MRAMIWKEVRELVMPSLIVIAIFIAIALLAFGGAKWTEDENFTKFVLVIWFAIGVPVVALFAGCYTLAREREPRTLEWLSGFPISRARIWAVKLIVTLVVVFILYWVTFAIAVLAEASTNTDFETMEFLSNKELGLAFVWIHMALAFFLFGLGFALSGMRRTPFEALWVGIFACVMLGLGYVFLTADVLPRFWGPQLGILYNRPSLSTITILALVLGSVCILASAYSVIWSPPLSFGKRHWSTIAAGTILTIVAFPCFVAGIRYLGEPTKTDISWLSFTEISPDGHWIAFVDADPFEMEPIGQSRRLWIMRSDGKGLRCLSRGPVYAFSWSPNSRALSVMWGNWEAEFHFLPRPYLVWYWIVDVSGKKPTRLPVAPPDQYAWIGFYGDYARVGTRFTRLGPQPRIIEAELPKEANVEGWSANDQGVYFSRAKSNRFILWQLQLPSGKLTGPIAQSPPGADWSSLSPDNKWIAWVFKPMTKRKGWESAGAGKTILARLDGSARLEFQAGPLRNPWSPDSRYLWLVKEGNILILDLKQRQVVREAQVSDKAKPSAATKLHWSIDGSRVAFLTYDYQHPKKYPPPADYPREFHFYLWVADADGNHLRGVTQGTERSVVDWVLSGWTSENKLLAQVDKQRLVSFDPDSGEQKTIFEVPQRRESD